MQAASQAYKGEMRKQLRDHSYIRVTIGLINQEAQASASVPGPQNYTYYSNLRHPLDNYAVEALYATCDQDYTTVDGSMYFLPHSRADAILNQGIVTEGLLGAIEIRFPVQLDIKGLTVEFGKAYPVDFLIESDDNTVEVNGNASGHFVTEEIFSGATYLRFVPTAMVNGQSRLRIHMITMGIGIYFDNRKTISATKKERVSPVMEDMPTVDFELVVDNKNRAFDIENEESTVNFLEIGQEINVIYGQELDDGSVEWMPGATVYLREWSADDKEMSFTATDRFDGMNGTYYRGKYYADGISLYDLAVDVLEDAGVDSRTYWLDSYLRGITVYNPIPAVSHREALQLIANAGRCLLYQDREGNIFMKSSFVPDMAASSGNEAYFSNAGAVLDGTDKDEYGLVSHDYTDVRPTQYFLPRKGEGVSCLNTGYISEAVALGDGTFAANPTVEIRAEAAFKCFGITLQFGRIPPTELVIHTYLDDVMQESFCVMELETFTTVNHEFAEFNRLVLEFKGGSPNSRIVLDNIYFGDSTDYELTYGRELTKTPKGTQLAKVRELNIVRTMYSAGTEQKSLAKETVFATAVDNRYTFYFSSPAYGFKASIVDIAAGQGVDIIDSSAYCVTVELSGVTGSVEVEISGYEYVVTQALVSKQLNPIGSLEVWENPLVSDAIHAVDLADWVGDYMRADREYELTYRGEPRIDANDIAFLENKYVPNLLIRVFEHTLKFNGALSGTIKARRDMSNVAATKNRLEGSGFF